MKTIKKKQKRKKKAQQKTAPQNSKPLVQKNNVTNITHYVQKRLEETFAPLGSMTDKALSLIIFFVQDAYKLKDISADVLYEQTPKRVVIRVYDEAGLEFIFRPKDQEVLKSLPIYLSVPDYVVEFAKRKKDVESIQAKHS